MVYKNMNRLLIYSKGNLSFKQPIIILDKYNCFTTLNLIVHLFIAIFLEQVQVYCKKGP